MHPPFSLIPHCTARRPKNLQRPTKRRHRASPGDKGVDSPPPMSSGPGHFIPQIDTLGAISYELFSAGLWPRWGPEPHFCRGSGLSQLRVTEMWDETCNLLPGPEPPSSAARHSYPIPATSSPFTGLLYRGPRGPAGRPPARLKPPKTLHTPPHCSCPGRILCLWKVS